MSGRVAAAMLVALGFCVSIVNAQEKIVDNKKLPYLLEEFKISNYPSFLSICSTYNDSHLDDGRAFFLFIDGPKGALVEIRRLDFEIRAGVEYETKTGNFSLLDPISGMWSINLSYDLLNYLLTKKFFVIKNIEIYKFRDMSSRRDCDIAYVSLNLYVRFYEHVHPWTGETVSVERVPEKRLNESTLAALSNWRNAHGMPWSTTGHAPELTVWDQHRHSVRLGVAALLMTVQLWKELLDTIDGVAREEGLSRREWAQRHISEFAGLSDRFLFWESFAWFTGPHYREGALPVRAERLLARMASGAHLADVAADEEGGFWSEETPMAERLPSILQSLETARSSALPDPAAAERPVAGFDVRYFLDRRKLELQRAGTWTAEEPQ